jgi:hypothetical protein
MARNPNKMYVMSGLLLEERSNRRANRHIKIPIAASDSGVPETLFIKPN